MNCETQETMARIASPGEQPHQSVGRHPPIRRQRSSVPNPEPFPRICPRNITRCPKPLQPACRAALKSCSAMNRFASRLGQGTNLKTHEHSRTDCRSVKVKRLFSPRSLEGPKASGCRLLRGIPGPSAARSRRFATAALHRLSGSEAPPAGGGRRTSPPAPAGCGQRTCCGAALE
jgi:hypothetical protein